MRGLSDAVPVPRMVSSERVSSLAARLRPHALVLAALSVVTVAATWPMLPRLGGFVVSKLDPMYTIWAMAWQAHALTTDPASLFNANIMYPFKGTLTFDELTFAEAVLSAPVYWLTGNPVLSHNLLWLLSFVVSGYAMWLLLRELTGSSLAGFVGGMAFTFSFYRFNHLPHTTLVSTEWMPLVLLAAYKLLWTRSWRWATLLGLFFTLQALSSHYLAYYTAMLLGMFVLFCFFAYSAHAHNWRERIRGMMPFLGKFAAAMIASLVVMLPVIVPFVQYQESHDFARDTFEVERYSTTLASFVAVYEGNPVYRTLLSPFADPGPWPWERVAFPGLATLLLALGAVVGVWRIGKGRSRRPASEVSEVKPGHGTHIAFLVIVAVVAVILSLGPTLQITYASSSYDPNTVRGVFPLPYSFLYDWAPGFKSMRVAGRITVLIALSLSVLAGFGAYYLLGWVRRRTASQLFTIAMATTLAALPVVETWSAPLYTAPVGTRQAVPPVYRWLAEQPKTVVVEYPMVLYQRGPANVEMANMYQYYSVYHWQNLVNASTTVKPFAFTALEHETEDCFPCPRSLDALWVLGVEYVVAHLDNLTGPQRTEFLWRSTAPEAKVVNDFILVKDFGADKVYRLKPRPLAQVADLIPQGASLLLADPVRDPIRVGNESEYIGGGYVAALGYYLRDHPLFGDPRLSYGEPVQEADPTNPPDYALLWANQDPNTAGYLAENRIWANEFVTLYKRGPTKAALGTRP